MASAPALCQGVFDSERHGRIAHTNSQVACSHQAAFRIRCWELYMDTSEGFLRAMRDSALRAQILSATSTINHNQSACTHALLSIVPSRMKLPTASYTATHTGSHFTRSHFRSHSSSSDSPAPIRQHGRPPYGIHYLSGHSTALDMLRPDSCRTS